MPIGYIGCFRTRSLLLYQGLVLRISTSISMPPEYFSWGSWNKFKKNSIKFKAKTMLVQ
jgi:hypothetical protein